MSKSSEKVKQWRFNTKERIVKAMGGQCVCCGYDKCNNALDLHHINPEEKEFGLGKIMCHPISWEKIVIELRKCVIVCNRCHQEIHAGITFLDNNITCFNEYFADYKNKKDYDKCPVCNKQKPKYNKTCSRNCAAKLSRKVDWNNIDLEQMLKMFGTTIAVADELELSNKAVIKRAKKLNLI